MMAALKWILTSIGISGIFIAAGFIVDFAYQDRLGYSLASAENLPRLSVEAGEFFLSLPLIGINWFADHPLVVIAGAVLLTVAILRPGRRLLAAVRRRVPFHRKISGPAVLAILLLLDITVFDIPMVSLHGLLVHGLAPPESLDRQLLVRNLAAAAWQDEVCSRVKDEHRAAMKDVSARCPLSQTAHQQRMRDRFALNLFATLFLSGLALVQIGRGGPGTAGEPRVRRSSVRVQSALLFLVLLDLVLLPYSYGKSVHSTLASEVVMSPVPAGDAIHGFLLYQRADALVLFEKEEKQIWVVPKGQVGLVRIEGEEDVEEFLINKKLESVAESPPPP